MKIRYNQGKLKQNQKDLFNDLFVPSVGLGCGIIVMMFIMGGMELTINNILRIIFSMMGGILLWAFLIFIILSNLLCIEVRRFME